ncbi:MAG: GumC family protein [Xenococcaceae cyanobacterium]
MTPPIVKRFLISFEQHKLLGFFSFALIVAISGVIALQPPPPPPRPIYKAIGRLSFSNPPPAFTSTGEQLQQQGKEINKDILLAPRVLQQVAEQLQFTSKQIIKIRDQKLEIKFPKKEEPQLITVQYTDTQDPEQAKRVLELFMKEMIEESRLLNTSQLRTRIKALEKRLSQTKRDLTAAEEAFYRYISKEGSALLAVQDGSLFNGITSSQAQQREIKLALDEVEGQINSLVQQLGLTPEQAYTSSVLSADPIIANLRAQILQNELQLELLQRDLRPEHPKIIELRKQQEANETLLQERAEELIGRDGILTPLPSQIRKDSNLDSARQELANSLVALQSQREGLLKQLESVTKTELELRQQYEQFPEKQLQQARLVQAVEFQRVIYQKILTALVDAKSAEVETVSSLAIAQPPSVPPFQPKIEKGLHPFVIIAAGAGFGLVAATGIIFLLATVDDRLHTPQELREVLTQREVPLLGQLPFIFSFAPSGKQTPILLDADSTYLSFYERFRSNIRRLGPESDKVVLITSITNEEGKSVSAYNLAIASAHAGKRTLLVEADLRSPSQAKSLKLDLNPEASIEPLRYYASRTDSISLVPEIENLYIVPSPGPQRQAAAIIESSELQLLLKDARGRFDMVVIDTPSLSQCNDALLLEPLTDGIVIVTKPGLTQGSMLGEVLDQFIEAELPLLGVTINCVENLVPLSEFLQENIDTSFEQLEEEEEEELVPLQVSKKDYK